MSCVFLRNDIYGRSRHLSLQRNTESAGGGCERRQEREKRERTQPRSRGTGRKEARKIDMYSMPRPIYRGSSRRNFKRGLTYTRVCMCAYVRECVFAGCRDGTEIGPPPPLFSFRFFSVHSGTYEGIKYFGVLYIVVFDNTYARALWSSTKGWRAVAMPNEGWAVVIVGKLNFVPEGPSDEVC